jgi:hypothetical protein
MAVVASTAAVPAADFTGEASVPALSAAVAVSSVVAVLVGATCAITDSLMMSSSAAFRPGAIRTDITVTTITRTITMDMAGIPTGTMVGPVTDTAMAADQDTSGVCGVECPGIETCRDSGMTQSDKSLRREGATK